MINFDHISKLNKYIDDMDFDDTTTFQSIMGDIDKYNKNKIQRIESCTNNLCGSVRIIEDYSNGIVVCQDCGQVLDGVVDINPEWKQFEEEDKANGRCGLPINKLLPQSSLGTTISGYGKNRLKTLHGWNSMPYTERSLNNEFKKIQDRCSKAKILKCIEDDAKIMYKMISECKHNKGKNTGKFIITRGINRLSIVAACLFYACVRKGMTRTSKEIASLFDISSVEMNRGCKSFLKLLKIRNFNTNMGTSKPNHFIISHCNELQISNQYIEQTLKIVRNIERLNIASVHTPFSIAAASILLMADTNNLTHVTKKKVSINFDISEVTVSKTYKKIEKYKNILIDDTMVDNILNKIADDANDASTSPEIIERMKKFGMIDSDNVDIDISDNVDIDISDNVDIDISDNVDINISDINIDNYNIKKNISDCENLIQKVSQMNIKDNIQIIDDFVSLKHQIRQNTRADT